VRGDRRWIDTGPWGKRRGGTAFEAVTWRGAGRAAAARGAYAGDDLHMEDRAAEKDSGSGSCIASHTHTTHM
jgi:hypothetical protein